MTNVSLSDPTDITINYFANSSLQIFQGKICNIFSTRPSGGRFRTPKSAKISAKKSAKKSVFALKSAFKSALKSAIKSVALKKVLVKVLKIVLKKVLHSKKC